MKYSIVLTHSLALVFGFFVSHHWFPQTVLSYPTFSTQYLSAVHEAKPAPIQHVRFVEAPSVPPLSERSHEIGIFATNDILRIDLTSAKERIAVLEKSLHAQRDINAGLQWGLVSASRMHIALFKYRDLVGEIKVLEVEPWLKHETRGKQVCLSAERGTDAEAAPAREVPVVRNDDQCLYNSPHMPDFNND